MTDRFFEFHTDAGHGWIKVTVLELREAGLAPDDFSSYSYRHGRGVFYLEEDCDAPKFIAAWQEATGRHINFRETYAARSFIRQLPSIHS